MDESGLMPRLADDELGWLLPPPAPRSDPAAVIQASLQGMGDVAQVREVVWPATIDGRLCRPPDDHLLDGLVREWILDGVDHRESAVEASLRSRACTINVVAQLRPCTACAGGAERSLARYDSALRDGGRWTDLCPAHYEERGSGRLGLGLGQYMITWAEVGDEVRTAFVRARAYWRSRGVALPDWMPWENR